VQSLPLIAAISVLVLVIGHCDLSGLARGAGRALGWRGRSILIVTVGEDEGLLTTCSRVGGE
jgi:hypothetical protein